MIQNTQTLPDIVRDTRRRSWTRPPPDSLQRAIADALYDGPATVNDLAIETDYSVTTIGRAIRYMHEAGELEQAGEIPHGHRGTVTLWQHARTKRAA